MKSISAKRILRLLLCLAFVPFLRGETIITSLMKHNLAAYPPLKEAPKTQSYAEFLKQSLLSQEKLDPSLKRKAAWQILERDFEKRAPQVRSVLENDMVTIENLNLLKGGEEEANRLQYAAHLVDRTSTEVGRVMLHALIAQPTDDCKELIRRQTTVKLLLEQPDLFNSLDTAFKTFQKSENCFLSFWTEDPFKQLVVPQESAPSSLDFILQPLKNMVPLITAQIAISHGERIAHCAMTAFSTFILPTYGFMYCYSKAAKQPGSTIPQYKFFKALANRLVGTGGEILPILYSFAKHPSIKAGGFIAAGILATLQFKSHCTWVQNNFTLSTCLQQKLCHVSRCILSLEKISAVLHEHPELSSTLNTDLYALLEKLKATNKELKQLFELLHTNTFKGEPSALSNYGAITVAYRILHEQKEHLEPLLCALGELDTALSTARLYKEFQGQRVQYCFAHYTLESEAPALKFTDLWSPFISPSTVVPNSIELGGPQAPQNLVITGPNEGGKSTFVKTMALALTFAKTIGIVPATEAIITPFSYIATYLNVTDTQQKSLFESQVERVKQIIDRIEALPKGAYGFVVIDELFNGTNAQVGEAASYSIADYLSKKPNLISVFPTHFPQLTTLEKTGRSINYKVSASLTSEGTLFYPFTVEKGISSQNFVLTILKNEGFNPGILTQTTELLRKQPQLHPMQFVS